MELCVHDQVLEHPTAEDISGAIDAAPRDEDWSISLESESGAYLEAFAAGDGRFRLTSAVQKHRYEAASPIDAATLKSIFLKFFRHDASWRADCQWKESASILAARDTSAPPPWAMAIVVGTIVVVGLLFWLAGNNALPAFVSFGNSAYFYVGLIALPMVVLVVVALAVKLIEARRAATWPVATGKVVKSGIEARHHQFAGEETKVTNVPVVEYEFSARGGIWRGNRIGIGEDSGGANTEAALRRYPVGAAVTVYYDPKDPANCVLERDVPKGLGKGCAIAAAVLAVIAAGGIYLVTNATGLIEWRLPHAKAPVVVFAACFGLAVLWFFFASRRMSKAAADWPFVPGKIVSSGTESYEKIEDGRSTTYYVPAVEFAYRVHGIEYRSRQIKRAISISGSQSYAERVAARYPQGSSVEVHYDPGDPTNAALENPTGYNWLLLIVALACFGIAVFASGAFN